MSITEFHGETIFYIVSAVFIVILSLFGFKEDPSSYRGGPDPEAQRVIFISFLLYVILSVLIVVINYPIIIIATMIIMIGVTAGHVIAKYKEG